MKKVNTGLARLVPAGLSLTEINHTSYDVACYIQSKIVPDYKEKRGIQPRKRNVEPVGMEKGTTWKNKSAKVRQRSHNYMEENHTQPLTEFAPENKIKKIQN